MGCRDDMNDARGVVLTVVGGVAEVHTCPGVSVLVVDYDNLDCTDFGAIDEETCTWLQANDEEYYIKARKRSELRSRNADAQSCD